MINNPKQFTPYAETFVAQQKTQESQKPQPNAGRVSTNFVSGVGTYISELEAQKLRSAFFNREKERYNHEEFFRAHFFGKDKLQELLNYHSEIVGMRIYYGVDLGENSTDDKKIVIYPVDKNGKDIQMGGKALDGGLPCPTYCVFTEPQLNTTDIFSKFTSEVGTYISEQEAQKLRLAFFNREKERYNHEEFFRAHFFGKDKLQELLNYNSEIVGMRIYYGIDVDGQDKDDKKIVIYPVDKNGKDIQMNGTALDGGLPCPTYCVLF